MGAKHSRSPTKSKQQGSSSNSVENAASAPSSGAKKQRGTKSDRGRSYLHASYRSIVDIPDVERDVGCMIASKTARDLTCCLCALDLDLMKDIFSAHRNLGCNAKRDSTHICTNCDAVICLECGELVNTVLMSLSDADFNRCGGCVMKSQLAADMQTVRASAMKDLRRHAFCPRCHPVLFKAFQEPFSRLVRRLVDEIEMTFTQDDNSSFLIVDIKGIGEKNRQAILEEAAKPTPLLPLEALKMKKEGLISRIIALVDGTTGQPKADITHNEKLELAGYWFTLAESISIVEMVDISDVLKLSRIECYERATQCESGNILFLCALLSNLAKYHKVTLDGEDMFRVGVAQRIIRQRPTNPEAWRNCGLCMDAKDAFDFEGKTYDRNGCFQRAIDMAPDERLGWYAAAFLMCPPTATFHIEGKTMDRKQILDIMLDDAVSEIETLEELIERFFGRKFLVFMTSEVSLLCSEHPRVQRYASEFRILPNSMIGMGAFGEVVRAERIRHQAKESEAEPLAAKILTTTIKNRTFQSVPELYMLMSYIFVEVISRAHFIRFDGSQNRTTIFMEYASHGSAFSYMKKQVKARLHESQVRAIIYQVLVSLRLLHYHGVVHQDIKPANILIYDSMEAKLADFGVSCMTYCDLAEKNAGGTELYMAPEVYNYGVVSKAGDIWSLAATSVELASCQNPIPDPDHVRDPKAAHPFRSFIPTHLSSTFKDILNTMLSYEPAKRPTSAQLLAHPYFTSVDLPSDAESLQQYEANKHCSGVPTEVENLEVLSTMGIHTRQYTLGTMPLATMRVLKSQMVAQQAYQVLPPREGSLSPQEVRILPQQEDAGGAAENGTTSHELNAVAEQFSSGGEIPSVSPKSPVNS